MNAYMYICARHLKIVESTKPGLGNRKLSATIG